jgi:hypothetical protein
MAYLCYNRQILLLFYPASSACYSNIKAYFHLTKKVNISGKRILQNEEGYKTLLSLVFICKEQLCTGHMH